MRKKFQAEIQNFVTDFCKLDYADSNRKNRTL